MRKILLTVFSLLVVRTTVAQHTFSIAALDTVTGEVGGAAATCYAVVNDIADVHPGVGFIHTQSYVDYNNQAYARDLMNLGVLPENIMDSLQLYDANGTPELRQYGAVMFSNGPHSAAFTGTSCFTYYGSRLGRNYAIAGNILLGPQILDSMEACFLRTQGTLADKLMAALQGAKVIGADRRCTNNGVSSLSAYMIVAQPTDTGSSYSLNLNVENVLPMDPIDSLQNLYNNWLSTTSGIGKISGSSNLNMYPVPANDKLQINSAQQIKNIRVVTDQGAVLYSENINAFSKSVDLTGIENGFYFLQFTLVNGSIETKKLIISK